MDVTPKKPRLSELPLAALLEQRDRLRAIREVALLERTQRVYESLSVEYPYIDPWEPYRGPHGEIWLPVGTLAQGRRYGADISTVINEQRLFEVQAQARLLLRINPYAKGLLKNLANYIVGASGFQFTAAALEGREASFELLVQVQSWLDQWVKDTEFDRRQREAFRRMHRDGECFLRIFDEEQGVKLRFVEPEQVRAPEGKAEDPEWSFGVHTEADDVETVLGYLVSYNINQEPEEVPVEDIEHLALNTDECVKRGWSDLEAVHEPLELARKLLRNLGEGSAIQAAIAYIREHETATKAQVEDFVDGLAEFTSQNPITNQQRRYETVGPGEIVDIPKGLQYKGPPLATANVAGHLEIVAALLRQAASSLNIPEFMISSDASNSNYSSTLVSESPFVKNAEEEQGMLKCHFLRIVWRAVKNAVAAGLLPGGLEEQIEIQCTPPAVAVTDRLQESQRFQIENASRVRSRKSWQMAVGLDPAEEDANFAEDEELYGPPGEALDVPGEEPQLPQAA